MSNNSKKARLMIRLSDDEKAHLSSLAKNSGLALSEYIRIRLLEEGKLAETQNASKDLNASTLHEKRMMEFMVNSYYLVGKVARLHLNDEEVTAVRERANKTLSNWGYK